MFFPAFKRQKLLLLTSGNRGSPFYWRSPMMIADVIRNAESEYVIYFLLAAYIEAVQLGGKFPEYLMNLPVTGLKDVEMRLQQLMTEFDKASERLHDKACVVTTQTESERGGRFERQP
jgi:hypothetical protein